MPICWADVGHQVPGSMHIMLKTNKLIQMVRNNWVPHRVDSRTTPTRGDRIWNFSYEVMFYRRSQLGKW